MRHVNEGRLLVGTFSRDGTEVAIKVLACPKEGGFREEVEVLSRFRHPNLVILMGFARNGKERYLVYELLPGGDLNGRLNKDASFTWKQRLSVVLDSALGLSHLHGSRPQVFHRDVKTQNILMDKNGTGKVADFGLACLAQQNQNSLAVSQTSGTIGYADPLYIRSGVVTEKSEVYSMGMVILEVLTGRPPALQHANGRIEYQFDHLNGEMSRLVAMVDRRGQWPSAMVSLVEIGDTFATALPLVAVRGSEPGTYGVLMKILYGARQKGLTMADHSAGSSSGYISGADAPHKGGHNFNETDEQRKFTAAWVAWGTKCAMDVVKFIWPLFYARTTESFDMTYRWHTHVIGFYKKRGLMTTEGASYADQLDDCLKRGYLPPQHTPEHAFNVTALARLRQENCSQRTRARPSNGWVPDPARKTVTAPKAASPKPVGFKAPPPGWQTPPGWVMSPPPDRPPPAGPPPADAVAQMPPGFMAPSAKAPPQVKSESSSSASGANPPPVPKNRAKAPAPDIPDSVKLELAEEQARADELRRRDLAEADDVELHAAARRARPSEDALRSHPLPSPVVVHLASEFKLAGAEPKDDWIDKAMVYYLRHECGWWNYVDLEPNDRAQERTEDRPPPSGALQLRPYLHGRYATTKWPSRSSVELTERIDFAEHFAAEHDDAPVEGQMTFVDGVCYPEPLALGDWAPEPPNYNDDPDVDFQ
ncbi:unnamed protein product [Polarella glacialis]|uniref:Protein kinase domain-containing protein n=1 Tax=Polarella glacialis TaxID=89957 RepID=A0A813HBH2_POLGL|nr:unnamed protein product [Polarella glacialis]